MQSTGKELRDNEKEFNLTEMQSAYLVGRKISLSGCHTYTEYTLNNLDVEKLELAWNILIKNHSILRSVITKNGKGHVSEYKPYKIKENIINTTLDMCYVKSFREKFVHRIFDVESYPLYEIVVSRFTDKNIIHFVIDSWIIDAVSIETLLTQWKRLYLNCNYPISFPTKTFPDAIKLIENQKNMVSYKSDEQYWKNKNSKFENISAFELNSNIDSFSKEILLKEFSLNEFSIIKKFALKNNILLTPFLLGTFIQTLNDFSESKHFAVICTNQNRPKEVKEINDIVGSFTSSTILWSDKSKDSFVSEIDMYKTIQKQFLEDMEHKAVSGVASVKFIKSNNITPIPIVFTVRNSSKIEESFSNDETYFCTYTPNVYLEVHIVKSNKGMQFVWNYTKNAFKDVNIQTMFDYNINLITKILERMPQNKMNKQELKVVKRFKLSPLQNSLILGRFINPQKNIGIFYKSFLFQKIDINKLEKSLIEIFNSEFAFKLGLDKSLKNFIILNNTNLPKIEFLDCKNESNSEELFIENLKNDLSNDNACWLKIAVSQHNEDLFKIHIILDMIMFDGISIQTFCNKLFQKYYSDSENTKPQNEDSNSAELFKLPDNHEIYEKDQIYWKNRFKDVNVISKNITDINNKYTYHYCLIDEYSKIKKASEMLRVPVAVFISAVYYTVLFRWNLTEKSNFVISDYIARKMSSNMQLSIGDHTNLSWIFDNDKTKKTFKSILHNIKNQFYKDISHASGNPLTELFSDKGKKDEVPINCVFTNCLGTSIEHFKSLKVDKSESVSYGVMIDCVISADKESLLVEWMVLNEFVSGSNSKKMFSEFKMLMNLLLDDIDLIDNSVLAIDLGTSKRERAFLTNNLNNLSRETFDEIIYGFNNTSKNYDKTKLIHNLFELNAKKYPNAVAVITDNQTVTYEELNQKANFLAHKLKRKVEPKRLIGVYFYPGIDLIISILSILKLGCAYVPLNINDPIERVKSIIHTAKIDLVLTNQENISAVKKLESDVFDVSEEQFDLKNTESCENLKDEISSEDLAYVIFTSGSTGTPKGVMVQHKPVINLIEWAKNTFNFSPNDKAILLNPVNFDLSVFDIFGMLSCGASIRIVSRKDRHNPYKLINIINNENITFWNTAPAYFQILFSVLRSNKVLNNTMRLFFLSGDWIPVDIFSKVIEHFPSASVIGLGGATEATVWSNYFKINKDYSSISNSIPYGKPIQNAKYYILDDNLSPCNLGTKGMLFIGGECLGKGYINSPKISNKSFIYDPFSEDSKAMMYNTGDMARYMPDGNIEFLGRADFQIKIRGYRVELGEIESALRKINIKNPIVLLKTNKIGNKSLIAFGQIEDCNGIVENSLINEKLTKLLPEYMIPSKIYSVNSIPLTDNGKVDNKKLLDIASEDFHIEEDNISLKKENTKFEVKNIDVSGLVNEAIKKILSLDGTEKIDQDTNLGYIGFTSLQYVLLGVELSEKLGQEINPALFFKYTTPKEITLFIEKEVLKDCKKLQTILNINEEKSNSIIHTDNLNDTDIAIIGVTCRLPGAESLEEFWQNLLDKKLCKQMIPKERWESSLNEKDGEYGNFISGIENFDSDFFNIIPREAESMDPRQRILLQSVWNVLEDAGYSPNRLRGSDTGFFIGSTGHDYEKIVFKNKSVDEFSLMGVSKTLITNRINYFYDWHGPSEVVDTACSSSLVAVHHAVRAICNNECTMAIAGGINLIIDSESHLSLKKIGMLAKDGVSKTFDKQGDGYARGEGCVLMLLKPLSKAIEDNDNIYAVIKSAAINHGGKANSLTAPNMNAQTDVITKAYKQAKINPRQLGFIETHGTGTALGDPIEVEAIKESVKNIYDSHNIKEKNKIVLGAVKPNIGHLEAAAGIAGLLKLLLVIKNKKFPGNVYPKTLNPNIDITGTDIEINTIESPWNTPLLENNEPLKRAGGVSSFGFGGVNAHVVLEEYIPRNVALENNYSSSEHIFLLSAKSEYSLREIAKKYISFLKKYSNVNIFNMCSTLQLGRDHLPYRLAIVTESVTCIISGLENYLSNTKQGFIHGNTYKDKEKLKYLSSSIDFNLLDNDTKARLWSYGLDIPWKEAKKFKKVSLPLYRFENTAYWISNHTGKLPKTSASSAASNEKVKNNTYCLTFKISGKERFIREHIINNERVLPGAGYLPYIQYACNLKTPFKISGLVWLNQIKEDLFPTDMNIHVKESNFIKEIEFSVNIKNKKHISCIAKAEHVEVSTNKKINITDLKSKCKTTYLKSEIYDTFLRNKINYGKIFRGIEKIWLNSDEMLAKINFGSFSNKLDIPPTIVDSGLQTIVFRKLLEDNSKSWFPFSIESIECFSKLRSEGYIYVKHKTYTSGLEKSDLFITDKHGLILTEIKNCMGRKSKDNLNFLKKEWVKLSTESSLEKTVDFENNGIDLFLGNYENHLSSKNDLNYYICGSVQKNYINIRSTGLNNFKIGNNSKEDFLNTLNLQSTPIKRIIYFPSENQLEEMFNICRFFYKFKNKIQFFIIDTEKDSIASAKNHALYGWGKSFEKENYNFEFLYVNTSFPEVSLGLLKRIELLKNDINCHEFVIGKENEIFYRKISVIESSKKDLWSNQFRIMPNVPYLITGGMGKIGQQIAKLISNCGGIPILVGRHINKRLEEDIKKNIHRVACYVCDVSKKSDVQHLFELISKNHGNIKGIFHCAGINNDKLLYSKNFEDVMDVVNPKVRGTINLDEITKNEPLDFFIMFSSLSSTLCNIGQTDYSYSNMFMDNFSEVRSMLVKKGLRSGKTYSISWPFVRNSGMIINDKLLKSLESKTGIKDIDISEIKKLVLNEYKNPHVTIIPGDIKKICKYIQECM